jgi:hypothetical protein
MISDLTQKTNLKTQLNLLINMKKVIKTMMMLFVASTFALTSCTDETEEVKNVEITMTPAATSGTHFVGDTLKLTVSCKGNADNKLKTLTITRTKVGENPVTLETKTLSGTDYIYNLTAALDAGLTGTVTYSFKLEGEKGTAQTANYVATIVNPNPLSASTTVIQLFGHTSGAECFMKATPDFKQYSLSDATANSNENLKNNIDLVFFFGSTNRYTLCSQTNTTMQTQVWSGLSTFWSSGNARETGLVKVTGQINYGDVAAMDDDRALVTFAQGKTFGTIVNNLAKDDVLLFKTKEGKLGLLKVEGVSDSADPNNPQASTAIIDLNILSQDF